MAHTKTASFYSHNTGSGYITDYGNDVLQATWDAIHDNTVGYDTTLDIYVESLVAVGAHGTSSIGRAFLPFDTSSLDNGASVSAATLTLTSVATTLEGGSKTKIGLVQTTQASSTSLAVADYDTCGSVDSPTEGATEISLPADEGTAVFTLNATGLTWISKTGYTKLGVRGQLDIEDYWETYTSDRGTSTQFYKPTATAAKRPTLDVTYTIKRYWVGGTGNWSDTAHWSGTSGGAGGESVPDADMDVYFDANSFTGAGQTCTINQAAPVYTLTLTGVTNSPTFAGASDLTITDTFTTEAGITWNHTGSIILNSTGTETLTSNSIDFKGATIKINGAGSSWTLADALSISTGTLNLLNGTLNTNGQAVTIKNLDSSNANTRTLTCGASAFTVTGDWDMTTATNLTYTKGTSTIAMSGNNAFFRGGGQSYNSVTLTGTPITISGANTFATLALTAAKQVNLPASTTQTVTTLTATGTAGNLITIRSTTTGTAATISKASGSVTCDYLDLQDSTATGGATFNPGQNSLDSGNNTGWTIPWANPTNAYTDDASYATQTTTTGKLYAEVSKDGGTTWQTAQLLTFDGDEAYQSYGAASTELWGTAWTGAEVTDANFKVRLRGDSSTSFTKVIYKTFGFDGEVAAGSIVTGIDVACKAKWVTGTFSLNHIRVKIYFGNSPLEVEAGSLAYATNGGAGGTGGLATYNGTGWKQAGAVTDGGTGLATVAAGSILAANTLNTISAITSTTGLKVLKNDTGTTSWNATTGTGDSVMATGPTLVTPTLGVATATSINKVALTAPATSATITMTDGKTLACTNTLTLSGTDSTVMTFPSATTTLAAGSGWVDAGDTWTYVSQAFTNDPAAGSNIELNMTDTSQFAVDQVVTVSSSAGSETAKITVVHTNTHITVDVLALNHTTTSRLVTGADDPTYHITVASDVTTKYYAGMKIQCTQGGSVKYGIITKVWAYAASKTIISIYGGTDYDLGATITLPYYSTARCPAGFPLDPTKWSLLYTDTTRRSFTNPDSAHWQNPGTALLDIHLGAWDVSYEVCPYIYDTSVVSMGIYVTLSTNSDAETNSKFTGYSEVDGASGNVGIASVITKSYPLIMTAKTRYYLIANAAIANSTTLAFLNDLSDCKIIARCAYL